MGTARGAGGDGAQSDGARAGTPLPACPTCATAFLRRKTTKKHALFPFSFGSGLPEPRWPQALCYCHRPSCPRGTGPINHECQQVTRAAPAAAQRPGERPPLPLTPGSPLSPATPKGVLPSSSRQDTGHRDFQANCHCPRPAAVLRRQLRNPSPRGASRTGTRTISLLSAYLVAAFENQTGLSGVNLCSRCHSRGLDVLLGAISAAAWWDDPCQQQLAGSLGPAAGGPCASPSTTGAASPEGLSAPALSHRCTGHLLQRQQTHRARGRQAKATSASPAAPVPRQLAPGPVLPRSNAQVTHSSTRRSLVFPSAI